MSVYEKLIISLGASQLSCVGSLGLPGTSNVALSLRTPKLHLGGPDALLSSSSCEFRLGDLPPAFRLEKKGRRDARQGLVLSWGAMLTVREDGGCSERCCVLASACGLKMASRECAVEGRLGLIMRTDVEEDPQMARVWCGLYK